MKMDQILFIIKQIKKRKILIPHTYHTEKYTSSSPNMTARLSIFPAGRGELPWILTQMLPPSLPFLFSAIMPFCYSILWLPDMTWRVLYTPFNYFPRYPQPKPKYYIYLLSYQNHKKILSIWLLPQCYRLYIILTLSFNHQILGNTHYNQNIV